MKIPHVTVKTEYTRLSGGMDTESPALSVPPGALLRGMNYVHGVEGGYERIDGYERFSGQAAPSAAVYYYAPCTFTDGGPSLGQTITGATSGATGVVIVNSDNYICFTKRSAPFTPSEVFRVGGAPKGTLVGTPAQNGETTAHLHATALNLAADKYRADIGKPAGDYPVRGLCLLKGVLYAFVDDATGATGEIYKQTTGGWSKVTLYKEISFSSGVAAIHDGDTITQLTSTATALVKRVVLQSGTWAAGTAAGRLIISITSGTFDATHDLQVSAATKATASSLATSIVIAPGGRYEFTVCNFTGSTDTRRIYGCDGKNRGFEFDGSVYVPLVTGMSSDKPEYVRDFKQQLFFSFHGSSQSSPPGDPYSWSAILGAAELAVGEDITGYLVESETLLIMSRNSGNQLNGENVDTFNIDPLNAEIGAIPRTCQNIGKAHCLDDRGIIQIERAQEYGNFNIGTVSRKIQSLIDDMQKVCIASSTVKGKNQYRLYGSDGTGICATIGQVSGMFGPSISYSFTQFAYPDTVACTADGEDASGKDVSFFGSTAGMVYQSGKGSSFDGEPIEAYIWLPFNNSKSPTYLKTYRKATIEMKAVGYSEIRISADYSYGDPEIQAQRVGDVSVEGRGGFWDLENWDEFYYDSRVVSNPSISLEGDGENVSIIIYSNTDIDLGHKLDGIILHYTPRRLIR